MLSSLHYILSVKGRAICTDSDSILYTPYYILRESIRNVYPNLISSLILHTTLLGKPSLYNCLHSVGMSLFLTHKGVVTNYGEGGGYKTGGGGT